MANGGAIWLRQGLQGLCGAARNLGTGRRLNQGDFERELGIGGVLDAEIDLPKATGEIGQLAQRKRDRQGASAVVGVGGAAGALEEQQADVAQELPVELA